MIRIADPERYGQAALARACEAVASAAEGGRNERLNRECFSVAQLVKAGTLDPARAEADLTAAAVAAGLGEHEAAATIKSAFRSAQPRAILTGGNGGRAAAPAPQVKPPAPKPAPKTDPAALTGTRWASLMEPKAGEPFGLTFERMGEALAKPHKAENKADLPALSLATFEAGARGNATFKTASGIALDLDHGNISLDQIRAGLGGVAWVAHTTWTSTPEAQRWRVFVPTCRPLTAEDYRAAVTWAAGKLPPGAVDPASSKHAQAFYAPADRPGYQHASNPPGAAVRVLDPDNPEGLPGLRAGGMVALTLREHLAQPIPAREYFLEPLLQPGRGAMIAAWRGLGKTLFTMSATLAACSGVGFLRWRPGNRRARALYLDGELPRDYLIEATATCAAALGIEDPGDRFRIAAYENQPNGIPNLADREGQDQIDQLVEAHGADLLILDNLSALASGAVENEAEGWEPIRDWFKRLRKAGVSVVLVHHAGKSGSQRGTSRREDLLDLSVVLRQPEDYQPTEGARFEVVFSKARGLVGAEAATFEARLVNTPGEAPRWETSDPARDLLAEVAELTQAGLSQRKIAATVGRDHSTVCRIQRQARKGGLL